MYGGFWKPHTRPGKKQKLIDFLKWDAEVADQSERDTLRFELYEDATDDSAIYLYEAYTDKAGFGVHKRGEPFQKFISGLAKECIESSERLMDWTTATWPPKE